MPFSFFTAKRAQPVKAVPFFAPVPGLLGIFLAEAEQLPQQTV